MRFDLNQDGKIDIFGDFTRFLNFYHDQNPDTIPSYVKISPSALTTLTKADSKAIPDRMLSRGPINKPEKVNDQNYFWLSYPHSSRLGEPYKDVDINMVAGTKTLSNYGAVLRYDPCVMQYVTHTLSSQISGASLSGDAPQGILKLSATGTDGAINGYFQAGTITFRPTSSSNQTYIDVLSNQSASLAQTDMVAMGDHGADFMDAAYATSPFATSQGSQRSDSNYTFFAPSNNTAVGSNFLTVSMNVGDGCSGANAKSVEYFIRTPGNAWMLWSYDEDVTNGWSKNVDLSSLPDGAYEFGAIVTRLSSPSNSSNSFMDWVLPIDAQLGGSRTFYLDRTPPSGTQIRKNCSLLSGSPQCVIEWGDATDNLTGVRYNLSYYVEGEGSAEHSWQTGVSAGSALFASDLAKSYYFVVRAVDGAGNQEEGFHTLTIQPPYTYNGGTLVSEYVNQSYNSSMPAGSAQDVWLELKNTGSGIWDDNTKLASYPRDQNHPLCDSGTWLSCARIQSSGVVQPGEIHRFNFKLHAPSTPGTYLIKFAMVQEGVSWLDQPWDGEIWFQINVTQPQSSGVVRLKSVLTQKMMDVEYGRSDNEAKIWQWEESGMPAQTWRLVSDGSGYVEIRSALTEKCVAVPYALTDSGVGLIQWDCIGAEDQKWQILNQADGSVVFQNKHSQKAIDIPWGSTDNGVQLQQYDLHAGDNQKWMIIPTDGCDRYEPDNTWAQAKAIQIGITQESYAFCDPSDQDWGYFDVSQAGNYTIETLNLASGVDTVAHLYNSALTKVAYNDDSGSGGLSSRIVIYLGSGRYYVKIHPYSPNQGVQENQNKKQIIDSSLDSSTTYSLKVSQSP